jgi:hypothetical protein
MMKKITLLCGAFIAFFGINDLKAQCAVGEQEIYMVTKPIGI